MKQIICMVFIVGIIALCGSGCTRDKELNSEEKALNYMEEKYDEPFEYVAHQGATISTTQEIVVSCESLPNQEILVQIENYTTKNEVFSDNLLAVKYYRDTINYLDTCMDMEFEDANIYLNSGLPSTLAASTSFEEFLADVQTPIVIMAEIRESSFTSDAQIEEVAMLIGESVASYILTVIVVEDDLFGINDCEVLYNQVANRQFVRCAKLNKLSPNDIKIDWLEN